MDDIGLHHGGAPQPRSRGRWDAALVHAMPKVMAALSTIGIAAMIWVGGGIIVHGLEEFGLAGIAHAIHDAGEARPRMPCPRSAGRSNGRSARSGPACSGWRSGPHRRRPPQARPQALTCTALARKSTRGCKLFGYRSRQCAISGGVRDRGATAPRGGLHVKARGAESIDGHGFRQRAPRRARRARQRQARRFRRREFQRI